MNKQTKLNNKNNCKEFKDFKNKFNISEYELSIIDKLSELFENDVIKFNNQINAFRTTSKFIDYISENRIADKFFTYIKNKNVSFNRLVELLSKGNMICAKDYSKDILDYTELLFSSETLDVKEKSIKMLKDSKRHNKGFNILIDGTDFSANENMILSIMNESGMECIVVKYGVDLNIFDILNHDEFLFAHIDTNLYHKGICGKYTIYSCTDTSNCELIIDKFDVCIDLIDTLFDEEGVSEFAEVLFIDYPETFSLVDNAIRDLELSDDISFSTLIKIKNSLSPLSVSDLDEEFVNNIVLSSITMTKQNTNETTNIVHVIEEDKGTKTTGKDDDNEEAEFKPYKHKNNKITYKCSYSNANMNLDELIESLKNETDVRMLLYGVSGSGKTMFAKELARAINKEIVVVKCSDLLSKWVGRSEKNIAKLFKENDGRIILLDEIDSFISSRSNSSSEENTKLVNEFLTQLDEFDGIFIGTSNLKDKIDSAFERRFDLKIEFDFMKKEDSIELAKEYLKLLKIKYNKDDLNVLGSIKLTPGIFNVVYRKSRFQKMKDISSFINSLKSESSHLNKEDKSFVVGFRLS